MDKRRIPGRRSGEQRLSLAKRLLFSGLLLLVFDVALAQLMKLFPAGNARESEQQYRISHDVYHHDLRKSFRGPSLWGSRVFTIHTNSLGFKDREVREIPLKSDKRRIVFLGDSVSEGIGLPFDETFVGIVDRKLRDEGVEVLNASVSSYSPSIYYRKTKYLIEELKLEFNDLVVCIDISDIHDEAIYYEIDSEGRVVSAATSSRSEAEPHYGLKKFLKQNSILLRLADNVKDHYARNTWKRLLGHGGESPVRGIFGRDRGCWTVEEPIFERIGRPGLQQAEAVMDQLVELARRHGKSLTVIVHPWPAQIVARDQASKQVLFWRQWTERRRIPFINMFPPFVNERDPWDVLEEYYIPWDVHLNEAGHRRYADEFLRAFRPRLSDKAAPNEEGR